LSLGLFEDLTALAQDMGELWAFVKMVMNILVAQNEGNFLTGRGSQLFKADLN
jgi:hypothetical protein